MSARNIPQISFDSASIRRTSQTTYRKGSMPDDQSSEFHARAAQVTPLLPHESNAHRRAALVQNFPLFLNLSPEECREIVLAARQENYERRQTIYLEGDPVNQIVFLTSGCAKVSQIGQNGSEVILRLHSAGEVVGKTGCSKSRHCSMAQALAPSSALVWDAAVFESLSQRFPLLRRNTVLSLCERLERLEERFREISTERVAARLSRELMRLLTQVGRRVNGIIEINLSREELAQLIGTTLFTVSRLLSDWDERGIVSTRREAVSINDLHALQQLAEAE
jgi:CRP-like cAMP-binding protein